MKGSRKINFGDEVEESRSKPEVPKSQKSQKGVMIKTSTSEKQKEKESFSTQTSEISFQFHLSQHYGKHA